LLVEVGSVAADELHQFIADPDMAKIRVNRGEASLSSGRGIQLFSGLGGAQHPRKTDELVMARWLGELEHRAAVTERPDFASWPDHHRRQPAEQRPAALQLPAPQIM
jgi:hypothetical protein